MAQPTPQGAQAASTVFNNRTLTQQLNAAIGARPDPTNVALLIEHFGNAKSTPLDSTTIHQLSFADWTTALSSFRKQLTAQIGANINPDLKAEVQEKLKADQTVLAQEAFDSGITNVEEQMSNFRADLIRDIKSRKFPFFNANTKSAESSGNIHWTTVSKIPDYPARAIGSSELAIASSTPLRNISPAMLENFFQAGRIDLCSALVEKFALNRGEYKGNDASDLQSWAMSFYRSIGVQDSRETLRYLNAFLEVISQFKSSVTRGGNDAMQYGLRVAMMQADFQKQVGYDSLLESAGYAPMSAYAPSQA